jgi:hypothetical protein
MPIEAREVVQRQYAVVRDTLERLRERIDSLRQPPTRPS